MDEEDISAVWRIWKRRQSNKETRKTHKSKDKHAGIRWTRRRDLLLAFAMVSLPMLVIAAILLAFVFNPNEREKQQQEDPTQELPLLDQLPGGAYYTTVRTGSFLLVASWASNIAEFIIAPFMLLFSYTVAREILQHPREDPTPANARPPLLTEILRGAHGKRKNSLIATRLTWLFGDSWSMALGCFQDVQDKKSSSSGFLNDACCQCRCIWTIHSNTTHVRESFLCAFKLPCTN